MKLLDQHLIKQRCDAFGDIYSSETHEKTGGFFQSQIID